MTEINIFIEYQKVFFEKENKGKKSKEYIKGYLEALNDIQSIIEYNTSKSVLHLNNSVEDENVR